MYRENYRAAQKLGKKDYQARQAKGLNPTLDVLDSLLEHVDIVGEVPLGLVDIPIDQIRGTKTEGRKTAFAANYMPILDENTEFAAKWISLSQAHLMEGIREPVKAYEYMNRFYILEGNKRVSVLKFFGADSIPGNVTRLVPAPQNTKESRMYYEFMDFYKVSGINNIWFSKEGSFSRLPAAFGKRKYECWSAEDRLLFRSVFARFSKEYYKLGGKKLSITAGDAFLAYLDIFGSEQIGDKTTTDLKNELSKMWDDILLLANDKQVDLKMHPTDEEKPGIITKILTPAAEKKKTSKIAFIHSKSAITSSWTYAHELGRMALADTFHGEITTSRYENITESNIRETIEHAIAEGNTMIFTTTPVFYNASLKAAVDHPDIKILNCSLNTSHKYVRTYYGRMYEAKFLTGVIAGIMTDTNKIGYIADYPINGMTANINAFAAGVHMVNPRAKVYLEWSTLNQQEDLTAKFYDLGATYISNQDMITPQRASRQFGLYRINGETPVNVAMPIWQWGKYYERIIRTVQTGGWIQDEKTENKKVLTYWWGMSAGVIDVICSPSLPSGVRNLVELLRKSMCRFDFHPFSGTIIKQDGTAVPLNEHGQLSPWEIITMDWLADNVIGHIPSIEEMKPDTRNVVQLEGVKKEKTVK